MRVLSSRLLLTLSLLTVSGVSQAGFTGYDPLELHIHVPGLRNIRMTGRVSAVGWRGRDRATAPHRLANPAALDGFSAAAPTGEWTEMVLVLDGPITLTAQTDAGAAVNLTLQVEQLMVPLQEPTAGAGTTVVLDLALPDWIAAAAGHGLVVRPGDALHDRLVAALEDGALGIAVP